MAEKDLGAVDEEELEKVTGGGDGTGDRGGGLRGEYRKCDSEKCGNTDQFYRVYKGGLLVCQNCGKKIFA